MTSSLFDGRSCERYSGIYHLHINQRGMLRLWRDSLKKEITAYEKEHRPKKRADPVLQLSVS